MKTSILLLIIIGLLTMSSLVGCEGKKDLDKSNNSITTQANTTEAKITEEEKKPFPHEIKNFDGYTFTFFVDLENANTLDINDYEITETNGEVLNDALYNRKIFVEETFNLKFATVHSDNIVSAVQKDVMAGTGECDAFMPRLMNAGTAVIKQLGYELTGLENLSLVPKYDSDQERYYHTLNNWHSYTVMLPISSPNIERSAYIVDALGYYGREMILDAYYDVCLTRKYTRDDNSAAMLDIIFDSTVYDLGTVYDIGTIVGTLESQLQKNEFTFTSTFEKLKSRADKQLQNILDIYTTLE